MFEQHCSTLHDAETNITVGHQINSYRKCQMIDRFVPPPVEMAAPCSVTRASSVFLVQDRLYSGDTATERKAKRQVTVCIFVSKFEKRDQFALNINNSNE